VTDYLRHVTGREPTPPLTRRTTQGVYATTCVAILLIAGCSAGSSSLAWGAPSAGSAGTEYVRALHNGRPDLDRLVCHQTSSSPRHGDKFTEFGSSRVTKVEVWWVRPSSPRSWIVEVGYDSRPRRLGGEQVAQIRVVKLRGRYFVPVRYDAGPPC
jgi:hypothetical protein